MRPLMKQIEIFSGILTVYFDCKYSSIYTPKDNATANRTARAPKNNRLGLGRELGRVAGKVILQRTMLYLQENNKCVPLSGLKE